MAAIIGDLSIDVNGVTLSDKSDIGLAWKWAAVMVPDWENLSHGIQCSHVSDALAALREAYGNA